MARKAKRPPPDVLAAVERGIDELETLADNRQRRRFFRELGRAGWLVFGVVLLAIAPHAAATWSAWTQAIAGGVMLGIYHVGRVIP